MQQGAHLGERNSSVWTSTRHPTSRAAGRQRLSPPDRAGLAPTSIGSCRSASPATAPTRRTSRRKPCWSRARRLSDVPRRQPERRAVRDRAQPDHRYLPPVAGAPPSLTVGRLRRWRDGTEPALQVTGTTRVVAECEFRQRVLAAARVLRRRGWISGRAGRGAAVGTCTTTATRTRRPTLGMSVASFSCCCCTARARVSKWEIGSAGRH